ncbi:MAG: hypothetical protein H0T15_01985 [Thermoleophilaceae bacterium]|nr:hypothetical protein [Thermoleophilaceae bacterium]
MVPGAPGRLAGAVYGTILVTALIAAYSEYEGTSSSELLLAVVTTSIVLWLAHVYARAVSQRMESPATRGLFLAAMRHERPIVEAAVLPAVILALSALGAYGVTTATDLAIGVGVAALFGWGYAIGAREGRSVPGCLLSGVVNATFGLVLVGLKTVVH